VAGGALATRRNSAGIRQFSATMAGEWLPVKEPVAGLGLGIAGKRQLAGGQVANICPSHTQPGPSQHFGDPATFQRSASRFFSTGETYGNQFCSQKSSKLNNESEGLLAWSSDEK